MGFCQQEKNPEDKSPQNSSPTMDPENNSCEKFPRLVSAQFTGSSNQKFLEVTNIFGKDVQDIRNATAEIVPSNNYTGPLPGGFKSHGQDKNTDAINCLQKPSQDNQDTLNAAENRDASKDPQIQNDEPATENSNRKDENENIPMAPTGAALSDVSASKKKKKGKASTVEEDSAPVGKGLSIKDFGLLKNLGKGAFGDVFLVKKNCGSDAGALYALKMVYKVKIKDDESFEVHFKCERKALETVRGGAFVSQLYFAFQTAGHLFIVMDYNSGGQLLQQFTGKNALLLHEVKFYMAELLLAVRYLHEHGIIHRDIKPENILLDKEGHVILIDYGLSKHVNGTPNESYVGTEPYIAPEILLHKPHDRVADFWSVGVLGYEMITGEPPFDLSQTDEKLRRSVLERDVRYPAKFFPKTTKSLINGLLQKNPKGRLGAATKTSPGGVQVVMDHQFFKAIDWKLAVTRKLKPPVVPKSEDVSSLKVKAFKEPRCCSFRKHFQDYEFSWLEVPKS